MALNNQPGPVRICWNAALKMLTNFFEGTAHYTSAYARSGNIVDSAVGIYEKEFLADLQLKEIELDKLISNAQALPSDQPPKS